MRYLIVKRTRTWVKDHPVFGPAFLEEPWSSSLGWSMISFSMHQDGWRIHNVSTHWAPARWWQRSR